MEQTNSSIKRRKFKQLTERNRYDIEAYLKAGKSKSEIARLIGCSVRTIQREIKSGLVEQLAQANYIHKMTGDLEIKRVYLADTAQMRHEEREANKGRNLKIGSDHKLVAFIEQKIGVEHWSPDAVVGYIKQHQLEFDVMICTTTIYNYIDADLFLNISNKDLLYKKKPRKHKYRHIRPVSLVNRGGKSIEDRPEEIENRTEFGHWEIDLVVGKMGTSKVILTLVERKTRKSLYVLCRNKTQKEIILALKRAQRRVKGDFKQVFKTITSDNGKEFLDGESIKKATHCDEIYYAHPYSSWERGSNENGNRILRRFVPKGINIKTISVARLRQIEEWVNNYPRKIFGYKSANEMYQMCMAA